MIPADIALTYDFLAHEKETEIRLIDPHKKQVPKSIFVHSKQEFLEECAKANGQWNVYVGINERSLGGTERANVVSNKTLVLDLDFERESNTATTESELQQTLERAFEVEQFFCNLGFARPAKAMSGNGVQLWFAYPVIQITDSNRDLVEGKVKKFISNVQAKFSSDKIKVDQIGDLPRIIKVIGTKSIKGIDTPERPHRDSKWLFITKRMEDTKFGEELLKIDVQKIELTKRKVDLGYWGILNKLDADEKERVSCVMQIHNTHPTMGKEEMFDYICQHNKWSNFNPEVTKVKIDYVFPYTQKDNPIKHEEIKVVQGVTEVPSLELIDFEEYKQLFVNTHAHLNSFNLVKEELALIGEDYYAVTKALTYQVESLRQPTIQFFVGAEPFDNRMHLLLVGGAGTGKGMAKKVIRNYYESVECAGARTNLEQLIGKKIKSRAGEEELKGYFGYKALIVDESQKLIQEIDDQQGAIMREIRLAMDVYGYNKSEKKLVDTHLLSYCPETRFTLMVHDIVFPPLFFDTGTFRRMFAFELKPQRVKANDLVANLTRVRVEKEIAEYINQKEVFCPTTVHFTEEARHEIVEDYLEFIKFLCFNPNQRVRAFGKNLAFAGKIYFFRLAAILGLTKNEVSISGDTAKQASLDAIHFLLNTIQVYGNKSNPTLSRDSWKTDSFEEAMLFEWMHYNRATSREVTPLSIGEVQQKIGDYFGVMDRQATKVYSAMKKKGLVLDYKGQHESKCWLGFNPQLDGFVDFEGEQQVDFMGWLKVKLGK
jgi:hypothetical protein